jgi:hypothetical protein
MGKKETEATESVIQEGAKLELVRSLLVVVN